MAICLSMKSPEMEISKWKIITFVKIVIAKARIMNVK